MKTEGYKWILRANIKGQTTSKPTSCRAVWEAPIIRGHKFYNCYLKIPKKLYIYGSQFGSLRYGVMVALQILALSVRVRILLSQLT